MIQMDYMLSPWTVHWPFEAVDRITLSIFEERIGILTRDRRKRNPPRP
jgi:hypothetical protein